MWRGARGQRRGCNSARRGRAGDSTKIEEAKGVFSRSERPHAFRKILSAAPPSATVGADTVVDDDPTVSVGGLQRDSLCASGAKFRQQHWLPLPHTPIGRNKMRMQRSESHSTIVASSFLRRARQSLRPLHRLHCRSTKAIRMRSAWVAHVCACAANCRGCRNRWRASEGGRPLRCA